MKPEMDPVCCSECGDPIYNREKATITPVGVYHNRCGVPNVEELL